MIPAENDTNPVRRARFTHDKIIIIDGTTVLTGSIHFTKAFEETSIHSMKPQDSELGLRRVSGADCVALFPNRSGVLAVFREDAPAVRSRVIVRHAHADCVRYRQRWQKRREEVYLGQSGRQLWSEVTTSA